MDGTQTNFALTSDQIAAYDRDGFVVIKGLFNGAEVEKLNHIVDQDPVVADAVVGRKDSQGSTAEIALWTDLQDDMFSDVARSSRVVENVETLMGGPAAFFHAKLTLKRPKTGGAWDWHQDYGYWYRDGYLFPDLASVFIALDPCKKINGCLQVLRGSHKMGRIEHGVNVDQVGADMTRVTTAMEKLDLVHVEMDPGDGLFFHSNLLHASGQNVSDHTRNVLLCCYIRTDNPPVKDGVSGELQHIEPVSDDMVMRFSDRPISRDKSFATKKKQTD